MPSPTSLKRTYTDAGLGEPESFAEDRGELPIYSTTQSTAPDASNPLPPASSLPILQHTSGASDTAKYDNSQPPTDVATSNATYTKTTTTSTKKKTKLTYEEREVLRIEKEFKERQKLQDKAKKDEEKAKIAQEKAEKEAQRVEEKRIRDAEKEDRRKLKLEQNRQREEEKLLKQEEKNKKARSQLRMDAFFGQPSSSAAQSPSRDTVSPMSSRRSSIAEINAMENGRSRSVSATPQKPQISDYERSFPPFYLQSHTTIAPTHNFVRDQDALKLIETRLDDILAKSNDSAAEKVDLSPEQGRFNLHDLFHLPLHKARKRSDNLKSVKSIVESIHGTIQRPIDLTKPGSREENQKAMELLQRVPVKFLKFSEDVRPPYIGTSTKITDSQLARKFSRNPFGRTLPDTNYDYDSEAEWEEPGEGEDLHSEGEEEAEEEDDEEMDGFLDDEEATDPARTGKRRPLLGNCEPTCTGICWMGEHDSQHVDLSSYTLDILMENPSFPIDPYSTAYWTSSTKVSATDLQRQNPMDPPRIPLSPTNRANTIMNKHLSISDSIRATKEQGGAKLMMPPQMPKRMVVPELMDDFKAAVVGNDLTKAGLVEVLKKKFPKQSKDTIKDTLDAIAERVGPKLIEKKWVLKSDV